jgi:hypothetical protein
MQVFYVAPIAKQTLDSGPTPSQAMAKLLFLPPLPKESGNNNTSGSGMPFLRIWKKISNWSKCLILNPETWSSSSDLYDWLVAEDSNRNKWKGGSHPSSLRHLDKLKAAE